LHEGREPYLIYLPPGYSDPANADRRYPALYLLHGAPGKPMAFINIARAGVALDEGVHSGRLRPFVLVMPDGRDGSLKSDTEWADTPHGRYETLVVETVHSVDRRFATIRSRRFRAIAGNSEGGYAAVNISLHHPRLFSIAEGWSGYYWRDREGPFAHASPAQIAYNDPSRYAPLVRRELARRPLHLFLYKGSREPASVRLRAERFAGELRLERCRVTYRVFAGGHDWQLWRRHTPAMLRYASRLFGARR
jgi:enterochelin esterase-like enzyme